jgi:MoxR-like ATPase
MPTPSEFSAAVKTMIDSKPRNSRKADHLESWLSANDIDCSACSLVGDSADKQVGNRIMERVRARRPVLMFVYRETRIAEALERKLTSDLASSASYPEFETALLVKTSADGRSSEVTHVLHARRGKAADLFTEMFPDATVKQVSLERFIENGLPADGVPPAPPAPPPAPPPAILEPEDEPSEIARYLRSAKNLILEGVPGTGKSHAIQVLRDRVYGDRVMVLVMHPSISYEDLIEGVRPCVPARAAEHGEAPAWFYQEHANRAAEVAAPVFSVVSGAFLKACARACADWPNPHLVVLDEINRCNVPRALGELLFLLEPSKRMSRDDQGEWSGGESAQLPYSGGRFFVPSNLHVLGTMNTTDRSTAPLDSALRRRFAFHRLNPIAPTELREQVDHAVLQPSIAVWDRLNQVLRRKLGPDFVLGHSYFFETASLLQVDGGDPMAPVRDMWRQKLLPQLADVLSLTNRQDLWRSDFAQILGQPLNNLGIRMSLKGSESLQSFVIDAVRDAAQDAAPNDEAEDAE